MMTTSSETTTPTELATPGTSAVPEGTTAGPGAVETTATVDSTTGLYGTTVLSLTERSVLTDSGAMATMTTRLPRDEESSTATESSTAASTEERTPTEDFPHPGANAVVGEITLPEEIFSESLNNKSSIEARDLSNQLKQGLEDILKGLGYRYETVDILKYRKGSVVASFVVVGGDLPAAKVKVAIRDFLAKNNGTLRGRPVDSESVVAKDVTNWCKVANGGCLGSECEWDYLSGTKTCTCLAGASRLNETACAQPQTPAVATTVDEKTGTTTFVPISDATEVTSEHPMTAEWITTPTEKGTGHLSRGHVRNNDPNDPSSVTAAADDNSDGGANGCLDDDIRYCNGDAGDSGRRDNDNKDFYSSGYFDSASNNRFPDHDRRLRTEFS
ncbi:hypothetical protein MRX96_050368 [Rhipicephalus microplus]